MTSTISHSNSVRWLLEVTAAAAPANPADQVLHRNVAVKEVRASIDLPAEHVDPSDTDSLG
jgi:hypothetical protein